MKRRKNLGAVQVVGLGQACVDYLGTLPCFPREDAKVELSHLRVLCGGPASTALVSLSRLGISTAFLGSVSDDFFGKEIVKNLQRQQVNLSRLKITPGYTSQFAFIAVTLGSGNRTIFWHRGSVPPLAPEDVDLRAFPNARILHVDGLMVKAAAEAARQAKQQDMKVVMDAGTMREGSLEVVSAADVVIASEGFAAPLVGAKSSPEKALQALKRLGPDQVIITLGARGSIGLEGSRPVRQEAFSVSAVDTTGAGDVYHGAYIYGLLQHWDMMKCMRFASAAAALKCTQTGAQSGIPDMKTILDFLKG